MTAHDFNYANLHEVTHRPWPMRNAAWVLTQTWHDLLFAHWPVHADILRERVPPEFPLDLFDGTAWLGIVPFDMTNVAPRAVPALPWISEFPELNVRTYVSVEGKPGIYFLSLDAGSLPAVLAARTLFNLPYYAAAMSVSRNGSVVTFESRRDGTSQPAHLSAAYQPRGATFEASSGTLEHFLTERYCLYNRNHRGAPYRLDIHHPRWRLQQADAEFGRNTMAEAAGVPLPDVRPLLHFSARQDMVAWAPADL